MPVRGAAGHLAHCFLICKQNQHCFPFQVSAPDNHAAVGCCCCQALAEGREWQLILKAGLASVPGYKQLRVCQMILQQLQQVLYPAGASAMVDITC